MKFEKRKKTNMKKNKLNKGKKIKKNFFIMKK